MIHFTGRYLGKLTDVSTKGDYGFIQAGNITRAYGSVGPLPTRGVYLHRQMVPYLAILKNDIYFSFEVQQSTRKKEGLDAVSCEFEPRLQAILSGVSVKGDYGFLNVHDLEISSCQADLFANTVPMHLFPKEHVFAHLKYFTKPSGLLKNGMKVRFDARRADGGRNVGKLQALNLEVAN